MTAYYNEHDPFAAAWLRELIAANLVAPGDVDERSIENVTPNEIKSYTQCHFFAGIGGWSYALRLAGWPDDRPVWTGSAPCQPFSTAGKGKGFADERHLWPAFLWLIGQQLPPVIFGEQVASKAGRDWFDVVSSDLEAYGYAIGAADLCAAGVGAPHIRQRLYFVAHAANERHDGRRTGEAGAGRNETREQPERFCAVGGMAVANSNKHNPQRPQETQGIQEINRSSEFSTGEPGRASSVVHSGPWDRIEWLPCADGKARPTKPGLFPLAHGVSNRVGRLRGYGNAIVPPLAAEFIKSYCDSVSDAEAANKQKETGDMEECTNPSIGAANPVM